MVRKTVYIFRCQKVDPACIILRTTRDLQYFAVVDKDIRCHVKGTYVNHFHVRIFTDSKDSTDLRILNLGKLLHRHPSLLVDRERIDMDFNTFCTFNLLPLLLEVILHLSPHINALSVLFLDLVASSFLIQVQTEERLYFSRIFDQKLKVGVCNARLMSTPILLNAYCRVFFTPFVSESQLGVPQVRRNVLLIVEAVEKSKLIVLLLTFNDFAHLPCRD